MMAAKPNIWIRLGVYIFKNGNDFVNDSFWGSAALFQTSMLYRELDNGECSGHESSFYS